MREIMDEKAVDRALTRLAHEIIEKNKGVADLVLLGVRSRGVPLGRRIAEKIYEIENKRVAFGEMDISDYRDDRKHDSKRQPANSAIDLPVDGRIIVLVDDVVYTGRTCRAALDAVMEKGRPRKIQFAALIDRGHRELPLRADFIGKNVPTSSDETVHVLLKEIDGVDKVIIERHT